MEPRDERGSDAMTDPPRGMETDAANERTAAGTGEGVLTLVCFTCGTEYYFADGEPPARLSCEKCQSTVFRSFHSRDDDDLDEAAADFRDSTERDLRPDDPEGDTMPGDIIDLNPDRGQTA